MNKKKKYERKIDNQLEPHEEFLIERMREEWEAIQKGARKEEIVRKTKDAGMIMGKTLLAMLLIGGVLTVAAVAPNIFGASGRVLKRKKFFDKKEFGKTKKYLKKQGYVQFKKISESIFEINLTAKGQKIAIREAFNSLKIKPGKWDGLWRIVIFDIPDKRKWERDALRIKLKQIGFHQLQESAFITPYLCREEIEFIVSLFNISNYVNFIEAKSISNEEDMRKIFDLS